MRKPNASSKLKTLSDEDQSEIFQQLREGMSYTDAVTWLQEEFDLSTSSAALSEFYRWYSWQQRLSVARDTADRVADLVAKKTEMGVHLTQDARHVIQDFVTTELLDSGDTESLLAWIKHRDIMEAKERQHSIDMRKIKLLEAKAAAAETAKRDITSILQGGLTPETLAKIEQAVSLL